jgi:hypothetical protein
MPTTASPPIPRTIPPLKDGDRLTRDEFERRYDAMPGVNKAELIEGVVQMPSPVRVESHGSPHSHLGWWLSHYRVFTPGLEVADNASVRLDLVNMPQPDVFLYIKPSHGGRAGLSDDDYLEGGPELIAEISASSVAIKLGPKLESYRRNGVREYIVWRVLDEAIDWFVLNGDRYEPLQPVNGVLRSPFFAGLWLDVAALVRGDLLAVLQTLQSGLSTLEHGEFVREHTEGA